MSDRALAWLEPGHNEDVEDLWFEEAAARVERYDQRGAAAREAEDAIAEIELALEGARYSEG